VSDIAFKLIPVTVTKKEKFGSGNVVKCINWLFAPLIERCVFNNITDVFRIE
jgi:hypothetical protein